MLEEYPDIISVDELCEILNISRNTAYDLLRNRIIRSVRIGRTYIIIMNSVKEFLEHTPKPARERFII